MNPKLIEINKVLDSFLNKRFIRKHTDGGEQDKYSLKKGPEKYPQLFAELAILCGKRVEKVLRRKLLRKEFYFVASKLNRYLKSNFMA